LELGNNLSICFKTGKPVSRRPVEGPSGSILTTSQQSNLKPKRERIRKDSIRVEVNRKHVGESERRFMSEGKKEHLFRRYSGNARSSF
jgi:hypothetical protein